MPAQNTFGSYMQSALRVCCKISFALLLATLPLVGAAFAQDKDKEKPVRPMGIFPNPQTRTKPKTEPEKNKPTPPTPTQEVVTPTAPATVVPQPLPETTPSPAPQPLPTPTAAPQSVPSDLSNPVQQPLPTAPSQQSSDPLFQEVSQVIAELEKDGFRKKDDFIAEKMQDDGSWTNDVAVQQAKRYVLLALCGEKCPMMNIRVYDETGKMILIHQEQQARPTIYFSPRRNATYRFKTTVTACRKEPCRAALSIYER